MSGASYSDHEIQHIKNGLAFLDGADAGPNTSVTDENQFNVTERGLDNDELAELVYLRADIALYSNSVGDQTTRNIIIANTDFGANLAGQENLNAFSTSEDFDVDDSGTDDFSRFEHVTDEAGQFYSEELHAGIGFRDTGNSVGANQSIDRVQIEMPFRAITGGGPFLDSTDDLTSRFNMSVSNAIDSAKLTERIYLVWDVDTVEGGRAAFGKP